MFKLNVHPLPSCQIHFAESVIKAQLLKSALCDVIKGTGTSPRLLPHPQLGVGDDIYEICELFLGGLVLFVHDCFMRLQVENYRC